MRRKELLHRGLALALVLSSLSAGAQEGSPLQRGFDLERLELNPGAEGSLLVGLGELLPKGRFRATVLAHYAHNPLLFVDSGRELAVVGSRATAHLAAAYAPLDWLQVGLQVPLVAFQGGNTLLMQEKNIAAPASQALATPRVSGRFGLLRQDVQGGVDLAVELGVGLPLGSRDAFSRDGDSLRFSPKVMVGRHFGFVRAGAEIGYERRPRLLLTERTGDLEDEVGEELRVGLALATTGRRMRWEFNVRGMVPLTNQPTSVELLPGGRYLVNSSLELFGLVGIGVGSAPGTPLFRLMVGGAFGQVTPPRGPGESSVMCEMGLPPEVKVVECPDLDEDMDGVRNGDDKCPLVAGDVARQGCSAQDTDGDGIEDMLDGCPLEPGPAARQGCPIPDQDGDEVPDEIDSCPNDPGPADNRGCPIRDTDGDGIDNDKDECPNEPGPPERNGCPESDSDKDGVPNRVDSCANEPGDAKNLGCPLHVLPLVELRPDRLVVMGKVFFEPSQARVQSRSYELLDWVAKVINEHPEIPSVVVGAHTDDRGFPDANRRLSQGRAEAVRQYLITKGVEPGRLQSVGFGQDRPIDSNATSNGRENNRRVEFLLVVPEKEKTGTPRR
ncbi:OmpA domain protein [Myxococcus hansupus]|uniref:OmpA domain protein n=1 Tax=Pseudomyxococcus hansupus TaxID=1297742 RepID=A0A0H4WV35_9BACT|nr:OmpA family protein [Myxococcus hansupus]AKQ65180.1 OmpA domain protein [Myxococcus hansupus]